MEPTAIPEIVQLGINDSSMTLQYDIAFVILGATIFVIMVALGIRYFVGTITKTIEVANDNN